MVNYTEEEEYPTTNNSLPKRENYSKESRTNKEIMSEEISHNKANQDIDVQLSDTMALIAGQKYETEYLKKKAKPSKTEKMKKSLLARKLADSSNPSLFEILI